MSTRRKEGGRFVTANLPFAAFATRTSAKDPNPSIQLRAAASSESQVLRAKACVGGRYQRRDDDDVCIRIAQCGSVRSRVVGHGVVWGWQCAVVGSRVRSAQRSNRIVCGVFRGLQGRGLDGPL